MNYASLPLVCMDSLIALEQSLEGQTAVSRGFVSRYVEMWPNRFLRLSQAVASANWDEVVESAMSLYSSSSMVGADRLGHMSGDLVEFVKRGQNEQARDALPAVEECGNQTVQELLACYVKTAS